MKKIHQLNVFIASPGDVKEEREIVREVCTGLNETALAHIHSLAFRTFGWEDRFPSAGNPQETINRFVKECDIFVCIFHKFFGSSSGKENSGTLEEFVLAFDSWKSIKRPHILFYFKDTGNISSMEELEEFKKVLELKNKIEKEGLLLHASFDTPPNFRKQFRKHMEDWIAENAVLIEKPKEPPSGLSPVLQIPVAYRKWVMEHCRYMDLKELMDKGKPVQVELPEVFIPLYTDPFSKHGKQGEKGAGRLAEEKRERVDIEDLIKEHDILLVEGQAGSGKTTLIKHMAYSIINGAYGRGFDGFLPVLVFLKDLQNIEKKDTERITDEVLVKRFLSRFKIRSAVTAEGFLSEYFKILGNGLRMETVKEYCKAGKVLFLFDGLDEIDPAVRETAVESLADFRSNYKHCGMVFSGRPHGMDAVVVKRFGKGHVKINALAMDQVTEFINRWFGFIFSKGTELGKKTAAEMIGEIKAHEKVNELINNPLMLTAVCILYYNDRKLPEQRAELYKKFTDNLTHRRFDDPSDVLDFLMAIAFNVHETKKRGFDRALALEVFEDVYPQKKDEPEREYGKRKERKFEEIEQDCGLLKLEDGQYGFWHLTFQEFLSARYVAAKKHDFVKELAPYWEDDWYREFVELFIGFLSIDTKGLANKIISDSLNKKNTPPFKKWRLAAASLLDMQKGARERETVKKAEKKLLTIIQSEADPKIKADAGELLGWLGDPRDLEEFVKIGGGEYELEKLGTQKIETFEIGKYLVTNQWFEKFVRTEGYKKEDYWSREGWKWLQDVKYEYPRLWHDRKWSCPNSPVVGISWYEADAFCRWLTSMKQDKYHYQLPTEQEWQAAAAGKKKRKYPWGGWKKNLCNNEESGIEKTTPVGIFPKGVTPDTGLADMVGNVWEWTRTDYDSTEKKDDSAPREWGSVLRGGAWYSPDEVASCAARGVDRPGGRNNDTGFRCSRTYK